MTYYSCYDFFCKSELIPTYLNCVDPEGFEPSTFSMPLRRAPNCAMGPFFSDQCSLPSGPEGIRTPDLLSAIEARSQLRYRPNYFIPCIRGARRRTFYLRHLGMSMKTVIYYVFERRHMLSAWHRLPAPVYPIDVIAQCKA